MTSQAGRTSDCPFCSDKVLKQVVKENAAAYVILSNPRKVPGHFLVIPKRHIEQPWQLKPSELQDIFELLFFVEQRIVGKLGDGVDIRQNYRPFLQQTRVKVDHVHFHIIPRSHEDYIYKISEKYEADLFAKLDSTEAAAVAKLLED